MIQAMHFDAFAGYAEAAPAPPPAIRMDSPSGDWTLGEFYERALWENEQIGQGLYCSPRYWYFGQAVLLVQAQVPPRGWKAWCLVNKIQRDRWKRGRVIAKAFKSADEVAQMAVEDAERLAREILGLPRRRSSADAKLRRSLAAMNKTLQKRLDEFASVTDPEVPRALSAEVRRRLSELDCACAALEQRLVFTVAKPRRPGRLKPPTQNHGRSGAPGNPEP